MTYLAFHLVFILPPLLVLLYLVRHARRHFGTRALWTLPVMALIALVYTTPWDNYLVYRGVWWYGPDRVLGTIGYVPYEEYMFFVLQPLLVGAWTYFVALRSRALLRPAAPVAPGGRGLGVAVYLLVAAVGALSLTYTSGLYLGLILAWAAPVLAAQWYLVAPTVLRAPGVFAVAVAVPTLYLWVADRYAIGNGIWSIAPQYTTGLHLFGLPMEEATFFLVTNLLVVQGVLLFLLPGGRPARQGDAVREPAALVG